MLTLIDEYTRESLAIRVERRLRSRGVIETLADAMLARGMPEHIRSENGTECFAKGLRKLSALQPITGPRSLQLRQILTYKSCHSSERTK
jgi:hypothetical protein